jgi:hypothetical protein
MNVYLAIVFSLLATLATARILPGVPPDLISRRPFYESELNITTTGSLSAFDFDGPVTAVDGDDAWARSINRGAKLLQGMKMGDKEAGQLYGLGDSAESPYDGDLHDVLGLWGYRDNAAGMKEAADKDCDMDSSSMLDGHRLKKTFDELGMGTKSKNKGGSNECFQIEHYNNAAVILDEDGTRPREAPPVLQSAVWYRIPRNRCRAHCWCKRRGRGGVCNGHQEPRQSSTESMGSSPKSRRTTPYPLLLGYLVGVLEPCGCGQYSEHQVFLRHYDHQHRNEQTY